MSMTSGAELPVPLVSHSKSFSVRIVGVLAAPRSTFRAIADAPTSLDVLIATFLITATVWAVVLQTPDGRFALLDRLESTALAFGQTIDDARYAAMETASAHAVLFAIARALAMGPLLVTLLSGLLVLALRSPSGTSGLVSYAQVLAVVAHAGVVLCLREIVAAPVTYVSGMLGGPLTLRLMLSGLDEAAPMSRFASGIDLFALWWIALLAVGLAVLYKRSTRWFAVRLLGAYIALVAIVVTTMAVTGGVE